MDNFEQLKHVWQQQSVLKPAPDLAELRKTAAANRRKLERPQLLSAIALLVTSIVVLWIGFFSGITFRSTLTYVAVILIALIPALQALINFNLYQRLRRIDVTAPITQHLEQWEQYYALRKYLIRVNIPLYYVLLNGAFGLYFIEILGYFSLTGRIVSLSIYLAWMLFAYFVLGKRTVRKETNRLETLIDSLRVIQQQLTDEP
ncbi:hypothetical protein [Spirosoma koreense]